jgi:hypothetical protein
MGSILSPSALAQFKIANKKYEEKVARFSNLSTKAKSGGLTLPERLAANELLRQIDADTQAYNNRKLALGEVGGVSVPAVTKVTTPKTERYWETKTTPPKNTQPMVVVKDTPTVPKTFGLPLPEVKQTETVPGALRAAAGLETAKPKDTWDWQPIAEKKPPVPKDALIKDKETFDKYRLKVDNSGSGMLNPYGAPVISSQEQAEYNAAVKRLAGNYKSPQDVYREETYSAAEKTQQDIRARGDYGAVSSAIGDIEDWDIHRNVKYLTSDRTAFDNVLDVVADTYKVRDTKSKLDMMSAAERADYIYLANTDEDGAKRYLSNLDRTLTTRRADEKTEFWDDLVDEHPYLGTQAASLAGRVGHVLDPLSAIGNAANTLSNVINGTNIPVDTNSSWYYGKNLNANADGAVKAKISDVTKDWQYFNGVGEAVYDGAAKANDFAVDMAIGAVVGKAAGISLGEADDAVRYADEAAKVSGTFWADPIELSRASVDRKVNEYVLNATHKAGQSKAKWFQEALGYSSENADKLARQIEFDSRSAKFTKYTEWGIKFEQTIPIKGANGRVIDVKFVWIRNNDGIVRLVTTIPTKK